MIVIVIFVADRDLLLLERLAQVERAARARRREALALVRAALLLLASSSWSCRSRVTVAPAGRFVGRQVQELRVLREPERVDARRRGDRVSGGGGGGRRPPPPAAAAEEVRRAVVKPTSRAVRDERRGRRSPRAGSGTWCSARGRRPPGTPPWSELSDAGGARRRPDPACRSRVVVPKSKWNVVGVPRGLIVPFSVAAVQPRRRSPVRSLELAARDLGHDAGRPVRVRTGAAARAAAAGAARLPGLPPLTSAVPLAIERPVLVGDPAAAAAAAVAAIDDRAGYAVGRPPPRARSSPVTFDRIRRGSRCRRRSRRRRREVAGGAAAAVDARRCRWTDRRRWRRRAAIAAAAAAAADGAGIVVAVPPAPPLPPWSDRFRLPYAEPAAAAGRAPVLRPPRAPLPPKPPPPAPVDAP